ncbi:hypothetical protein BY996DRAFT_6419571 [Phakopsora pachyrhizi]|nr:hypothetical protein BY996DRAFT_6419571 [Phakopsora pachyrhizi]
MNSWKYYTRSSSTYCLSYPQQGPSQRFTLKASRLSSLNSKLSGRPPSHPVSTLDSAAAEEKEDVGAPQSEVNVCTRSEISRPDELDNQNEGFVSKLLKSIDMSRTSLS